MPLRHLFALLARHIEREQQREQWADYRAGTIAAAVINAAGGWRGGRPAKPWDFFPHLHAARGVRDPEKQIAILRALGARVTEMTDGDGA